MQYKMEAEPPYHQQRTQELTRVLACTHAFWPTDYEMIFKLPSNVFRMNLDILYKTSMCPATSLWSSG